MNYSPFDLVYKLGKFLPIKLVICVLKEIQRAHKVYHGVLVAAKLYPSAYVIVVMVGTIKGQLCFFWFMLSRFEVVVL